MDIKEINIYFVTCPHCNKEVSFNLGAVSRNDKVWFETYNRRTYCPACGELIDEYKDKVRFRHIMGENVMVYVPGGIVDPHFSE